MEQLRALQEQGVGGKSATKKTISDKVKENSILDAQNGLGVVAQSGASGQKAGSMGFYLMIIGYVLYYTWSQ